MCGESSSGGRPGRQWAGRSSVGTRSPHSVFSSTDAGPSWGQLAAAPREMTSVPGWLLGFSPAPSADRWGLTSPLSPGFHPRVLHSDPSAFLVPAEQGQMSFTGSPSAFHYSQSGTCFCVPVFLYHFLCELPFLHFSFGILHTSLVYCFPFSCLQNGNSYKNIKFLNLSVMANVRQINIE